jgi:hypothetical protein
VLTGIVVHRANSLAALDHAWRLGVEAAEVDVRVVAGRPILQHGPDDPPGPTLAEAVATVPAGRRLFVEIKDGAADVLAAALGGPVLVQGRDAELLTALAAVAPAYWTPPRPYVPAIVDAAHARGFAGLALDHRLVDASLARAITSAGLLLDVWTVDDPAAVATWRRRGARWVETDRAELLRAE